MPKPMTHSFSDSELALKAVQAYHRAAALTGSLYQVCDCAALPADVRPRFLAEIVLRGLADSRVSMALSGDTTSNPLAVPSAVFSEIRRTWGDDVADDVKFRVDALMAGNMAAASTGRP